MKIRKNKGMTLVALVVTIVILLIISSVIIVEMNTGDKFKDYQYMKADIETIKDSILIYYHDYAKIPVIGESLSTINLDGQASPIDNINYYEVDLEQLGTITLNYGRKSESTDIYIINEKSQEVYYLKGIEYEGEIKHK